MGMRLRQVALVVTDLAAAEAAIERDLDLELCFRDPGVAEFGLHNALYPVGDKFLELVSPVEPGTTAGRLLHKRGGDGGYMVILQVDDLEEVRARVDEAGARVVHEAVAPGVRGLHLHPSDVGGAILSVDRTEDWDAWPWAGPDWQSHRRDRMVTDLVAVEIEAEHPRVMAARWAEVLGCARDGSTLVLDQGQIRFVQERGRGEGVGGVDLMGASGESADLELCGMRVRIRPQP